MKTMRYLSYAGLAGAFVFLVTFVLAVYSYHDYNVTANYISDMGVSGLSSLFFNYGVIISGALDALFGLFLCSTMKKTGRYGGLVFFITGIALICVGLFPSQYEIFHSISAAVFFLCAIISMILIGFEIMEKSRPFGYVSMVAGIIVAGYGIVPVPAMEHAAVFVIWIFGIFIGIYAIRGMK